MAHVEVYRCLCILTCFVFFVFRITSSRQIYDQWLREQRLRKGANSVVFDTLDINEVSEGVLVSLLPLHSTDSVLCRCGGSYDLTDVPSLIVDSVYISCDTCSLILHVYRPKVA